MRNFILLSIGVLLYTNVNATHIMGGEITYTLLDSTTRQYKIRLVVYRDCAGSNNTLNNGTIQVSVRNICTNGTTNVTLTKISGGNNGVEKTALCPGATSTCSGGTIPGISQYVFEGNYNFPTTCNEYYIFFQIQARNTATNNVVIAGNNTWMYTDAYIRFLPYVYNSSSRNDNLLLSANFCLNSKSRFSFYSPDINNDSVVYELVRPRQLNGTPMTYTGTPMPDSTNPTFNCGQQFNTQTGEYKFVPNQVQNSLVAVKIKEYKNGVLVGYTIREAQFVVQNTGSGVCGDLSLLNIKSNFCTTKFDSAVAIDNFGCYVDTTKRYDMVYCEGTPIDLDIKYLNKTKIPVNLNTYTGYGTITDLDLNKSDSIRDFKYTWTNPIFGIHNITLDVNNCPTSGGSIKYSNSVTTTIRVLRSPKLSKDTLFYCLAGGAKNLRILTLDSGVTFTWNHKTGFTYPTSDTTNINIALTFDTTYIINYKYYGGNCTGCNNSDTLVVKYVPDFSFTSGPDSSSHCLYNSQQLTVTPDGLFPPYTYKWSPYGALKHPVSLAVLDSASASLINNPIADPNPGLNKFYVSITANTGCELKDTFTVLVSDSIPIISAIANKYEWCNCDTTKLNVVPGFGTCGVPSTPNNNTYNNVTLGAGATNFPSIATPNGYPCIFGNYGGPSVKHRIFYKNADLVSAGLINKTVKEISFYVNSNPGILYCKNAYIRMACTSSDTVTASVSPTQVYFRDSLPIPNSSGWITMPLFGNGYNISNSDNLIVEFCFTNPSSFWSNPSMKCDLTSYHSVAYDSIGNCASTTWKSVSKLRPQTRFNVANSPVYTPELYSWTPITGLSSTNISNPIATACNPIDYIVTATKGVCQAFDTIHIHADSSLRVIGRVDTTICANLKVQLNAVYSGTPTPGNSFTFLWRALEGDTSLRDSTIINPIVQPNKTVRYVIRMSGGACIKYDTVVVTRLPDLQKIMTKSDPTCILSNGIAKVSLSNGLAPFTYLWSNGSIIDSAVNLNAGKYYVTISSANGCVGKDSITLNTQIINPILSFNKTNVRCFGESNGATRVLIASQNIGPFLFNWTPSLANKDTNSNLIAGTYQVMVYDSATGCSKTDSVVISQPARLLINADSVDVACNGASTGTLTSNVSGGTPSYTYIWSDIAIGNNAGAINKPAGAYTVTVTDSKGCKDSSTTQINQPTALSTIKVQRNVSCFNGSNAMARVTLSGGTSPYSYSWFKVPSPVPIATNIDSVTNQSIGTYIVAMLDNKNCPKADTFIITQPIDLTGSVSILKQSTCAGFNNGIARIIGAGGVVPYTYIWSSGLSFNGDTAFGLNKGSNSVTIRDANLCQKNYNFNILEPDSIKTKDTVLQHVSCFNGNDGKGWIRIVSGGTAPFNFTWSPVQPNNDTISGLSVGTYYVTISDAAGSACFTKDTLVITQPTQVVATVSGIVPVTCYGLSNGVATVTGSGGTPGYTYLWDNGATTSSINTLNANNHKVIVTDSKGCKDSSFAFISQPIVLDVTLNDTNSTKCYGSKDGQAIVNVNGGNYPYSYNWMPAAADNDSIVDTLAAGSYQVIVTDFKGCKDTLNNIVIKQPDSLTLIINQTPASCFDSLSGRSKVSVTGGSSGYTYLWNTGETIDSIQFKHAGNYSVTVRDVNLCTKTTSIIITQPTAYNSIKTTDSVTCFGLSTGKGKITVSGNTPAYTYLWNDGSTADSIFNKPVGTYTVITTDTKGCKKFDTLSIFQPAQLQININAFTNITCFGLSNGTASTTTVGGNPAYTYLWSGGGTSSSKNTLILGSNQIVVTDRKGCKDSTTIFITQPPKLTISFVDTQGIPCWFDTIGIGVVAATGGIYPYTYNWLPASTQTDSIADNLPVGNHRCIVRDVNNCTDTLKNIIIASPDSMTFNFTLKHATCFDSLSGKAKVSITGGTGNKSFLWNTSSTADSIINLHAGNYTVTVTDAYNCKQNKTITINQPIAFSDVKKIDSASCNGTGTGKAKITVSGNTAPYTYLWSDGSTLDSIANKNAGIYTLITTDFNNCKKFDTFNIYQPSTLTASLLSKSNVKCYGDSTGSAIATILGGNKPYIYLWNNGGGTDTFKNNLWSGNHILTVTDAKNCSDTVDVIITQPLPLVLSLVDTNAVLCRNDSNGVAIVSTTGGTYPFVYNWMSSTIETDSVVNTLKSGVHQVIVTDLNLCKDTLPNIVVVNPDSITINFVTDSVTCYGFATGKTKAIATGGTGGVYTYNWSPNGETTDSIVNKVEGIYTVTVRDINLCTASKNVNIHQPNALTTLSATQDSVSCNGLANGSAKIRIEGGTKSYLYSWNTIPIQTDSIATGLLAGTYIVTTTDAKLCQKIDTILVRQPDTLIANATVDSVVSCFGGGDGKIRVNVSGGNLSYHFNIGSGNVLTNTFNNLIIGNYTVTITDQKGCQDTANVTMTQPTPITNNIDKTNASCLESANGNAFVYNVSGGNGSFTYLWNNGQTSDTAKLIAGLQKYFVTIKDAKACIKLDSIVVDTNYILRVSTIDDSVTCFGGSNGSVDIIHINGQTPYSYNWNTIPLQTSKKAIGLSKNTYSVTITDANNCTVVAKDTVHEPLEININIKEDQPLCYKATNGKLEAMATGGIPNYSYVWSSSPQQSTKIATGLASGNYTVTITDSKSCSKSKSFYLTEPAQNLFVELVQRKNLTCFESNDGKLVVKPKGGFEPYTYNWDTFTTPKTDSFVSNLEANVVYQVVITDSKGCTDTARYSLEQPESIIVDNIQFKHVTCPNAKDGSILLNIKGGTVDNANPYKISLNGGDYFTNRIINNLPGGKYTLYIKDKNGCTRSVETEIREPKAITTKITPKDTTIELMSSVELNTIVLDTSNITPKGLVYYWIPSTGLNCNDCPNPIATPLKTTNYKLVLTYNKSCTYYLDARINVITPNNTFIPNAFTPINQDGKNDSFFVFGTGIKSVSMIIFNRWGEKLFDGNGQVGFGWDGRFKGEMSPTGIYTYSVSVIYINGEVRDYSGSITIIY